MPDKEEYRSQNPWTPRQWHTEIVTARTEHHSEERLDRWRRALQLYRTGASESRLANRFLVEAVTDVGGDSLRVNLVAPIFENFVSSLYPDELKASILPKRPNGNDAAFNVQELFNNRLIPEARMSEEAEQAVWLAVILSDGFLKLGYVDAPKRRLSSDPEDLLLGADDAIQIGGGFGFEGEAAYRGDLIWVQAVHPKNIIPAPGALSLEDTPYLIHKIRRRFEHVIRDPNYSPRARDRLKPMTFDWETENPNRDPEMLTEPEEVPEGTTEYIDLYEIYDYYNQEFRVIAEGNMEDFLREGPWPFQGLEGYPFAHLGFKNDPESFFHIPMVQDIADLQEELNTVSTLMLETLKRSVPFITYDKSKIDPKQLGTAGDADLMGFVGIDGNAKEVFGTFPDRTTFSPDLYGVRNMIIQAMMLITGMTDFLMGQSQKTKSATEAAATSAGFTSRMKYRRKTLKRFLRDMLRKSYQITRHRMTTDQWIRVVGATGAEMLSVTPEDVRQELDVDIAAEIFDDRMQDPVRLKLILDAMTPFMQTPDLMKLAGINPIEMMKRYLQAIGEKDFEKLQPVAREPVGADIENKLMETGQKVNVHPLDDDQTHMQAHIAAQDLVEDRLHVLFQSHLTEHAKMLEAKIQMMQQQAQAAAQEAAGPESPSRRSTPNAGEQQARTMQVANQ